MSEREELHDDRHPVRARLDTRRADVLSQLESARCEMRGLSLEVEGIDPPEGARKRWEAAQRRVGKLEGELSRLDDARDALDENLATAAQEADKARRRELLREYIEQRDRVQETSRQVFDGIMALEPLAAEARSLARSASRLARQLGLPVVNQGVYYPDAYPARAASHVVLGEAGTARDRMLAEAKRKLAADWKAGHDGERVRQLQAELGTAVDPALTAD